MGLLQYIYLHYKHNTEFSSKNNKDIGLYNKAIKILNSVNETNAAEENLIETPLESIDMSHFPNEIALPFFLFHDFLDDNEIEKAGILVPYNNYYKLLFSKGLTEVTCKKSSSSFDFWNGTIKTNNWETFKDNELSPFYQLFDNNDLSSNDLLHIKMFSLGENNTIIFYIITKNNKLNLHCIDTFITSIQQTLLDNVIPFLPYSLVRINKDIFITESDAYLLTLSMKDFFANEFTSLSKPEKDFILFHLFRKIKNAITEKNICILTENNNIKLALFNNDEDDSQMMLIQITKIISDYLSPNTKFSFNITYEAPSNNIDEIKSFLLQDE